ncbi:MAG TPA: ABC transporter permease [Candidatus Acidoferrales bacterium]|nr:ABC transporter permease [Candidatus Acidoferrales bacterium]
MGISVWLRTWRRSPLLTGQFALTIAIGMGAASALTSLMLALGYQPLPYRNPEQLVEVRERTESGNLLAISGPDLTDFADATRNVFASLGGFWIPKLWLLDHRGSTEIRVCGVQSSVFSDLGMHPVLGRGIRPDDEPLTGTATSPVWISYRLRQTRYSGSRSVVGTTIGIADNAAGSGEMSMRIAGVLPPGVSIPLPFTEDVTDLWYLLPRDNWMARSRGSTVLFGVGRLRPGVSAEQAQAALAVVAQHLGQQYSFDRGRLVVVQTLEEIAQGPARKTMGLLALGVGFVFLLGCVNLAILMGAEGRRRRREIAIRAILGAKRSRLWREVAAEKCLLTLLSLGLGVAFAFELLRVLTQMMPAAGLGPPLLQPPPLNLIVLLGFGLFALLAALVWSALLVSAADGPGSSRALAASSGLGYTGLSDSSPGAGRWRLALLAAQAGIGICLLAAAALTARTYAAQSVANLGPDPRHTVLLSYNTRDNILLSDAESDAFNQEVLSRLERLPGTQAIAQAEVFPPWGIPASFMRQGDAVGTEREAAEPTSVSPGYFRTLGIPILFGRGFDDTDIRGGEPVAIISLEMARKNWNSPEQAVGSWLAFAPKYKTHYKVVGVAADFTGFWSQQPEPTIYFPEAQWDCCSAVILRTTASPRSVAVLAPQVLAGMPIAATISDVSTMQARWQATLTRPLARMAGMLLLALLGLALSVQGVYAVAAATVAARRHELAVRSALGALPGRLAWNVTRELLLAVIAGVALGAVASLDLRPVMQHWLGPVAVWQAEPIAIGIVLLVLAAAVGCYIPARAAARANPVEILRQG